MTGFKTIAEEVQEEQRRGPFEPTPYEKETVDAHFDPTPRERDPLTQELEALRDISLYLDALPPQSARRVLQFCISRTSERLDREALKFDGLELP